MKRGQVTQFIIAGLIILIAVILILVARSDYIKSLFEVEKTKLIGIPSEIEPVKKYIQDCLNEVSLTAKDIVLLQGGYYEPKDYIELDLFKVSYWYKDGKDISPSLEIIETEISKFINNNLNDCILAFPDENYNIILTKPITKTTIKNNLIIISTKYPMNIEYKNTTFKLNKFNTKLDLDIINIINSGKKIIEMEINIKDIDIELLENLNYKIDIFPYDNTLIYSLSNNETTLMFANKIK